VLTLYAAGCGLLAGAVVLGVHRAEDGRVTRAAWGWATLLAVLVAAGVYGFAASRAG
jgi:hypothetical protein